MISDGLLSGFVQKKNCKGAYQGFVCISLCFLHFPRCFGLYQNLDIKRTESTPLRPSTQFLLLYMTCSRHDLQGWFSQGRLAVHEIHFIYFIFGLPTVPFRLLFSTVRHPLCISFLELTTLVYSYRYFL